MRNLVLALLGIILLSCNKDRDNDIVSTTPIKKEILLTKRIEKNKIGTKTYSLVYSDNKLQEEVVENTDSKTTYFYENDRIVKITNNSSTANLEYDTNNNLVKKTIITNDGETITETYTYKGKTEIAVSQNILYKNNQREESNYSYNLYPNGDIKSFTKYQVIDSKNSYLTKIYYYYDKSNSPRKNIKGMDKLIMPFYSNKHNITMMEITNISNNDGNSHQSTIYNKYIYEYNADNYPIKIISNENGEESEETLEYNQ